MKKLAALFLSTLMLVTMMTTPVGATGNGGWAASKSKQATNLDGNFTSKVTLSLPSAEEELVSDIVFVLDKSSCKKETAEKAEELLDDLLESVGTSNAEIRVGVIVFGGEAKSVIDLQKLTKQNVQDIYNAVVNKPTGLMGGTNMEAGLILADAMLSADSDIVVDKSRRHVILVSDGLPRLFTEEGETKAIFHEYTSETGAFYTCEIIYWDIIRNGEETNYAIPGGKWDDYLEKVSGWVETDGNDYIMDYVSDQNSVADAPSSYVPKKKVKGVALSMDRAIYDAYDKFKDMENRYNCYANCINPTPLGEAFMGALNGGKNIDFDEIKKEIFYLLDAGSTVVDHMGYVANDYDFALKSVDSFEMSLGGLSLKRTEIGSDQNKIGFGEPDEEGKHPYVVTYSDGEAGAEHFVLEFNAPVSNFKRVELSYEVVLKNPKTASGTYGTYDEDGGKGYGGLYTNNSAILTAVDSSGEPSAEEEHFNKPTVSYTVSGGSTTPPIKDTDVDEVSVRKIWDDDNAANRPTSVQVQLYKNGVAWDHPVTLSDDAGWSHKWVLLEDDNTWTVDEVRVPSGYKKQVVQNGNTFIITNYTAAVSPATGDAGNMGLLMTITLLFLAGIGIGLMVSMRQSKKHS